MTPAGMLLRAFAVFTFVIALAACVDAPRLPLMSPLEAGGGHGYSERQLAVDRFEVSYLGPRVRSSLRREQRAADTELARNQAFDLALWRAAVLSVQQGYPAFTIEDKRSDIEVEITEEDHAFSHFPVIRHRRHGPHHSHFGSFHGFGTGFRRVRVQAHATLIVALLKRPAGGAFDAAATVDSLRRKHPDALVVPQH